MSSMSSPIIPRRSARIATLNAAKDAKVAKVARVAPVARVVPAAPVTPVAPVAPVDPYEGLTPQQRVRAEHIHKKGLEREALRWRYYGPLSDAVNVVRDKLNLLYEPGSKGWWVAFDAHPAVQEWQGAFFQIMNVSSGW